MTLDERQFVVKGIMDSQVPIEIRRNYVKMREQSKTFGVTSREHKLWMAQNPMVGENRSMIGGTAFKPPEWSDKHIKFKRERPKTKKRK